MVHRFKNPCALTTWPQQNCRFPNFFHPCNAIEQNPHWQDLTTRLTLCLNQLVAPQCQHLPIHLQCVYVVLTMTIEGLSFIQSICNCLSKNKWRFRPPKNAFVCICRISQEIVVTSRMTSVLLDQVTVVPLWCYKSIAGAPWGAAWVGAVGGFSAQFLSIQLASSSPNFKHCQLLIFLAINI